MNTRIGDGPIIQPGMRTGSIVESKDTGPGQGIGGQSSGVGPAETGGSALQQALAAFAPALSG